MKMPSRQTLAKLIFFTFIAFFIALIGLYLYNPFSSNDSGTDNFLEDEKRGSVWAPFGSLFSGDTDDNDVERVIVDDTNTSDNPNQDNSEIPRLRQVSSSPTVAAIFYLDEEQIEQTESDLDSDSGDFEAFKKNTIRYALKENGHVYQTHSDTLDQTRVSITTIPKIAEAIFTGPLTIIYRYLGQAGEVKTFSAEIIDNPNGTEGQKVQGIFLPDDIIDIDVNIAGTVMYSELSQNGSSFVTTNYLGENKTRVFTSPLTELDIDFDSKGRTALISTRPSASSFGRIFSLNTESGSTETIVSGQRALKGLANSNFSKIALSSKEGERHVLKIRDSESGSVYETGLETFVEKCVWSLDNVNIYCAVPENTISSTAPDTWYQGIESYSDLLWVINTNTQSFEVLMSPIELAEENIDMIDLGLSTDEQFIHFINKKDLTLWSYKLN